MLPVLPLRMPEIVCLETFVLEANSSVVSPFFFIAALIFSASCIINFTFRFGKYTLQKPMSSSFYKIYNEVYVKPVINFVMQDLQALAEFIKAEMDKQNLNSREVSARSGGLISHMTVWNIINESSKEVKARSITGLARGLKISEDKIYEVLRRTKVSDKEFNDSDFAALYFKYNKLSPKKKIEFKGILQIVDRELDRLSNEN